MNVADGGANVLADAGANGEGGATNTPADAGANVLGDGGATNAPADAGTNVLGDGGATNAPADAGATSDAGPFLTDGGATGDADAGLGRRLSVHTLLGLPDDSSVGRPDRWLLVKPQFVASYDTTRKTPRWVSWTLDSTWLGTATRATSFRRDSQLPTTVGQASNTDYTNSGFDRGHLCPSADRTFTDADNDATFVFTNVVPQTHQSNAGTWATFEDEARRLVGLGKTVSIVAGPIFGVTPQAIGNGVPVPLTTFKVLVVFDQAPTSASAVTASTRVIAVNVPNTSSVSGDWRQFRVSVRTLEQLTGLDFLADVPRATQDVVETRLDTD